MNRFAALSVVAIGVLSVACSEVPTDAPAVADVTTQLDGKGQPGGGGGGGVSDPTATFTFGGTGTLGLFGDGFGAYEHGKCGVVSKIFATTAASGSGDAILDTSGKDRKCKHSPRTVSITFQNEAGGEETEQFTVRVNVHEVQSPTTFIPVDSTETRGMNVNPWSGSRCDNIHFKENLQDGTPTGAQSVLVTRLAGDTWRVQSQSGGKAFCADGTGGGELIDLPVDFTIVSSTTLPS